MSKKPKQPTHDRYYANYAILDHLQKLARENKDLRFSQLLLMSGVLGGTHFVNSGTAYEMNFYEESEALYQRITKKV